MPTSLRDNLTSKYFSAAQKLYSKDVRQKIVAYVESYDDIAFWRSIFEEFNDDKYYFHVLPPSSTSLSKGKKTVLLNTLNTDQLGKSLIACVDSDYDFLLQGATSTSRKINRNKYIFQTYAYAIENHQCFADNLHQVCVLATLNDRMIIDFKKFFTEYSTIIYPLFLWNIWFYRQHDTNSFPMNEFNSSTRLRNVNLYHIDSCLNDVRKEIARGMQRLENKYPQHIESVKQLGVELEKLGLIPTTTYMYIQGHHLMENVVMKLLIPICTVLRREREEEIKRLAEHEAQYRNELTCYQNSQVRVEVILRKNNPYRFSFLGNWLREDLKQFLNECELSMQSEDKLINNEGTC